MGIRGARYLACIICVMALLQGQTPVWGAAVVYDGTSISRQSMRENLCAITFDDGPSTNTGHLLDQLAAYGVPATFFLLGKNAALRPQMVRRIVAEGHEVGNHSWSHPKLRALNREQQREELARTDALLRELGVVPRHMRPPYGAYNEDTLAVVEELGLSVLLWSQDSHDWRRLPVNYALLPNTMGHVYATGTLRGIFLFHDTRRRTVDDLPRIIQELRAGGCQRFVTVSEYLDLLDDAPPLLMTRRAAPSHSAQNEEMPPESFPDAMMAASSGLPAGSTPVPMARCSHPWLPTPAEPMMAAGHPTASAAPVTAAATAETFEVVGSNAAASPAEPAPTRATPVRAARPAAAETPRARQTPHAPAYRVERPEAAEARTAAKPAPHYRIVQPYPVPQNVGTGRSGKGHTPQELPRHTRAAAASDTL